MFTENPEKSPMFCEMLGNFADVEFGVVHKRFNLLDLEKYCRVIFLVPKVGFNTAENGPSKVVSNQPRNTSGSNEHLGAQMHCSTPHKSLTIHLVTTICEIRIHQQAYHYSIFETIIRRRWVQIQRIHRYGNETLPKQLTKISHIVTTLTKCMLMTSCVYLLFVMDNASKGHLVKDMVDLRWDVRQQTEWGLRQFDLFPRIWTKRS